MIILKKTLIFQVSRGRGSNISKGVKLFPGVVQLLIPYIETHISRDFLGGLVSRPFIHLWIRTCIY